MEEASDAQRRVGLVVREQPQGWSIELTRFHRTNVVICVVVTGKRTLLIGAYLPPSNLDHLPELEEALKRFLDKYPIVLGDLNDDIQSHNPCSKKVAEILMEFGMVNLLYHTGSASSSKK